MNNIIIPTIKDQDATESGQSIIDQDINQQFCSTGSGLLYSPDLPESEDVFSRISDKIMGISNLGIKKQITSFIYHFKTLLLQVFGNDIIESNLSKLSISEIDGAFVLEWIFKNFRIGFAFEENEKESSYYFICDNTIKGSYISESNFLSENRYTEILTNMISFVLKYT